MEDEFVYGIGFILQGRDHGEALAPLEKREELTSTRGGAGGIDEAELTPGMNRRAGAWAAACGLLVAWIEGGFGLMASGQDAFVRL